jgi:uncharacterized heparinase superfamily protein
VPNLATYWHTVRHLKTVQIYGRLVRALPRRPKLSAAGTYGLSPPEGSWTETCRQVPSMLAPDSFRFLNEERTLLWPQGWSDAAMPLLWLYNLHYFDDFNTAGAGERARWHEELLDRWIRDNPVGTNPGWDSYPTSLRIVNWIKWDLETKLLPNQARLSLGQQASWLSGHLEWHLLGNHLFANAKALVFAGCYFDGPEASRWLARGQRIVGEQLQEQILPDGGNFELSPMYHAIFLADLLDLVNLGTCYPGKARTALQTKLRGEARKMLNWLRAMVHPDGEIALFNDSAFGIAATLGELEAYAARLGIKLPARAPTWPSHAPSLILLAESGYARLECSEAVAICDVARVGPDYLPGHAHADTLSFELSVRGRRFIVNGGTSRYGSDEARVAERGTRAHSTVTVDDSDSSEVWSGFRVARRAKPFKVGSVVMENAARLEASHDGYTRLHRSIIHRRSWEMTARALTVEDFVTGTAKRATARFLLHREIDAEQRPANTWVLRHPDVDGEVHLSVLKGEARIEPAWHSVRFGERLPTKALAIELLSGRAKVEIAWS